MKIKFAKRINIVLWIIGIIIWSYLLITSHIFTPLKFINLGTNKQILYTQDEVIYAPPRQKLNNKCYKGNLDDLDNKEIYIGVFNYLCETFNEQNIKVEVKNASKQEFKNLILAKTSSFGNIIFYKNSIESLNPESELIAHMVFHEYIHLLMFRHMANGITIDYKSNQLLSNIRQTYQEIPEEIIIPNEYAISSKKEQIAEILGIYLSKKTVFIEKDNRTRYVLTSNVEQDLYAQFLNNL